MVLNTLFVFRSNLPNGEVTPYTLKAVVNIHYHLYVCLCAVAVVMFHNAISPQALEEIIQTIIYDILEIII